MAASRRLTRFYSSDDLGWVAGNFVTGTWTKTVGSNIIYWRKTATDETSTLYTTVPHSTSGLYGEDAKVSVVTIPYVIGTADLDAAPTATMNKISIPAATGVVARAAVTQVLSFGGDDAVGVAFASGGQHTAIITVTTPLLLTDEETLNVELAVNAAAGTTIDFYGMQVTYV